MSAGRVTGALVSEDFSFHPCVDAAKVESDRAIRFIPPDGEFQLMSYRLSSKMKPLIWVESMVQRHAHSRIEYIVKVKAQFKKAASASDVKVTIPCPPDADTPVLAVR
jgi:AP-1 complex subunit mu